MNLNRNNSIMRKKSENFKKSITLYNKDEDNLSHNKRSTLQCEDNNINISKSAKKIVKNEDIIKGFEAKPKDSKNAFSVISANDKNFMKKKQIKKHDTTDEREKTFYNKINRKKTMKKRRENTIEEKYENEDNNNEVNYDKLISKNIEKNQQNLNNPEEYFEGFFNDIISKKKQGNKITGEKGVKKKITPDV